jgi:hypothetical protein
MTMGANLRRLHPYTDEHTRMVIDQAAEVLGFLRGCRGPFIHDPAMRLHLFESLRQQLTADLMATAHQLLTDDDYPYTHQDLNAYLDRSPGHSP